MEKLLEVRVTSMSGGEQLIQLDPSDSIATLRHKVSENLGLSTWQVRLVKGAEVVTKGCLKDFLEEGGTVVDLMAITMLRNHKVEERSKELHHALRFGAHYYLLPRHRPPCYDVLQLYQESILAGDINWNYGGRNMLELAVDMLGEEQATKAVEWMVQGGVGVNEPSGNGYTPLLTACSRGLPQVASSLRRHGAKDEVVLQGQDALIAALKFFEACVKYKSRPRAEDLRLAQLCLQMRAEKIAEVADGLLPRDRARLLLSQAATELALLSPTGAELSQAQVLARSGQTDQPEEDLFRGWPAAFLTFVVGKIPEVEVWDEGFVSARLRLLTHRVEEAAKPPTPAPRRRRFHSNYSEAGSIETEGYWYFFPERVVAESWLEQYDFHKRQNRKWETSKANGRSCRRAPVMSRRRQVSYSARMARKMPAEHRRFHVEAAKHRASRGKAGILRKELEMDLGL